MFKHYLITRFNLKKLDWATNKNDVPVLTDEWHVNRFELFYNFCLPSVKAQTNQNFEWLIFFDSSTKEVFRNKILEIKNKTPFFKPFFINGMEAFLPAIKNEISKLDSDYIITSRLDNDDCLHKNYIDSIQQKFNHQEFLALDYINGYTLQIHPKVRLGYKVQQYNPFLSLIERNKNPKTIWDIPHNHWKKSTKILQIKNERVWSSVIHSENKVNEFTGFGKVNMSLFFSDFKIDPAKEKELLSKTLEYRKWLHLSIVNKTTSYWKLYSKRLKKKLGFYK